MLDSVVVLGAHLVELLEKIICPVCDVLLGLMQAEKVIGRDNVVVVDWFYPGE